MTAVYPAIECPRKRLAKHRLCWLSKPAELVLCLLLATGGMLFDPFGLPWPVMRWALVIHIALAVTLLPLILVPFWLAHRGLLGRSLRPFQRWSGRTIEALLLLLLLAGAWLAFVGNNGTAAGAAAHWTHLVLALPLVPLVAAHAWRFSALRLAGAALAIAAVLPSSAAAAPPPHHAVESRSLLLADGGKTLYSANFDGGSITKIDRKTGRRLGELPLGGDIRSVALDPDRGVLAATDDRNGTLDLVDAASLSLIRKVHLGKRPHGVLYDARNRLFWVTATESDRLYGVDESGKIRVDMAVAATPRGLALLPDGRLLVTHAMIGKVSIYDTATLPPRLDNVITLAVQQNPDQTVSQGLPRVLDRIAVSPDLKQAWLPHELWNFDHPFQFQSTVFPAISVLSLKPGHEHEVVARRKQLFKQINILENGRQTRIVSNPADAAFSNDGSRVYVTMSGSEDLVVFDLSRAVPIDAPGAKAQNSEGAKAVQIFRHLPGENPRGLVVDGGDIYVQNAMSLDISHLTTGGSGPFARASVVQPRFAQLVAHDPVPPAVRRGERLFNLGNTAAFPNAPMTGDNWMSCSSCHVDGFNYTNRYLFRDTPVDKFHSAFTGHGNLKTLIAGDFVGDYIRMVRDTQGGMGADTRFPTPNTDPDHPPAAVAKMMRDLHAFVTSPGNLPLLSTWLRAGNGTGSVDPKSWVNPALCGRCHSSIFKDWANSMHHMMGQSDPYYMVIEDLAAKSEGEPFRVWCMGCHAPQAALSGQRRTAGPSHMFDRDGSALVTELRSHIDAIDEGTGCLTCHRADEVENAGATAGANGSMNLSPGDRPRYPGEDSSVAAVRWLADRAIRAKPQEHAQSFLPPPVTNTSGRLCSACHEEFAPGTGAYIISTYSEWAKSPFNAPGNPAKNRTCMDCHMHASVAAIGKPVPGRATDGGPVEPNVVTHNFVGGQYQLVGLRDPKLGAMSVALLKSAARLGVRLDGKDRLVVRVSNVGTGHNLPGGVSNFRQMWLELRVTDASGKVVLSSGRLAADGTLDPNARLFHKKLGDISGHDVGMAPWRYARMLEDTRIPAAGHRDEAFDLPPDTAFPITAHVRLMFRTFPKWITDRVRKRYPDLPPPQPVDMTSVTQTLDPS